MDLAGRTLPNPDDGGVQVEPFYAAITGESINGITTSPIYYRPNSGAPYLRPKYIIRLTWSDLVATEKQQLELAVTAISVSFGIMRIAGLGITRYDPPAIGGASEADSAYVMVAPGTGLTIDYQQAYRTVGGTTYGPLLYTARLTLYGNDIRYLYDLA